MKYSRRTSARSRYGWGFREPHVVFGLSRSLFRPQVTRPEGPIGKVALADSDIVPEGRVFFKGHLWTAESDERIQRGEKVRITEVCDLKARVRHASEPKEEKT
jgi:membrane-bound ClpP family serine protease